MPARVMMVVMIPIRAASFLFSINFITVPLHRENSGMTLPIIIAHCSQNFKNYLRRNAAEKCGEMSIFCWLNPPPNAELYPVPPGGKPPPLPRGRTARKNKPLPCHPAHTDGRKGAFFRFDCPLQCGVAVLVYHSFQGLARFPQGCAHGGDRSKFWQPCGT